MFFLLYIRNSELVSTSNKIMMQCDFKLDHLNTKMKIYCKYSFKVDSQISV
jgi:hypothetical protein